MSARGISAGKAFLELSVNDKSFSGGLKNAASKLSVLGGSMRAVATQMGAVGASITAAFGAALKIFSDVGSELNDMRARTGLSATALSELKFAAEQTGAGLGSVEIGVRKMQKAIASAVEGNAEAITAFDSLGLSIDELKSLSPDEQFNRVAKAIGAIQDPTQRAAAAMKAFGRSGTALLPMIAEMDSLREQAHKLGLVWSDEMVSNADKLGDVINTLKLSFVSLAGAIANSVAPYVTALGRLITANMGIFIEWIKQHGIVVITIAGIGVALTTVSAALGTFTVAVGVAAASITALNTLLGITAIEMLAIVSPVALVVAGIGALAAVVVATTLYTGDLQRAISSLMGDLGSAITLFQQWLKLKNMLDGALDPNKPRVRAGTPPPPTPGMPGAPKGVPEFDPEAWRGMDVALQGQGASGAPGFMGPLLSPFQVMKFSGVMDEMEAHLRDQMNFERVNKKDDGLEAMREKRRQQQKEIEDALTSIRPTSSNESRSMLGGRMAEQVFGGGMDTAAKDRKTQIQLAKESRDHLKEIRKKAFQERTGFKAGNN